MVFDGVAFMIIGVVGLVAKKKFSDEDESEFGRPSIIGPKEICVLSIVLGALMLLSNIK